MTAVQNPTISFTKTVAETDYAKIDDVLHYTLTATNTGNVTLHDVVISDNLLLSGLTYTLNGNAAIPGALGFILQPGDVLVASGSHTITQADLDAGHVGNSARVDGKGPNDQPVEGTGSTDVPATQTKTLSLIKSASPTTYSAVRDLITYTYVLENTGNVTLNAPFTITDNVVKAADITVPATPTSLAPGDHHHHRQLHDHPGRPRRRLGDQQGHRHRQVRHPDGDLERGAGDDQRRERQARQNRRQRLT